MLRHQKQDERPAIGQRHRRERRPGGGQYGRQQLAGARPREPGVSGHVVTLRCSDTRV